MAQTATNPYSYFTPVNYWDSEAAKKFQNAQFGLDTSTGKRDTEKVLENLAANPFAVGDESVQFSAVPGYDVAAPFDFDPYRQFLNEFDKKTMASNAKQQLLGLGSALGFTAASMPFVERLRNLDYKLGLQADIESPTRQSERNLRMQQQQVGALGAESDYLRALAAVRQGAVSGAYGRG